MLPPEFRDEIMVDSPEGKLMLAEFDGCVTGYPMRKWEELEESFSKIKNPTRKIRDFHRSFFGSAQEVVIDRQGRILVPPSLRLYGQLDKDVVLVGIGQKFEIWDTERLAAIRGQDFSNIFEDIAALGVEVSI